ncbi:MAG: HD domain-containing protein, partial [Thermodesulfovibrionales bacterium]|nr:HD domain-containing protein [Thermodesulfovibrionales bacterium]
MHTLFWLLKVVRGLKNFDDLSSLITQNEVRHFKRACEFILRSRICLHVVSNRKNEVLSFEYQDAVSSLMGFKKTNLFLGSEIFMRIYYRHSRTIMETLKKIMNIFGRSIFSLFPALIVKKISNNFSISKGEIIINDPVSLSNDEVLIEAFWVYAITNAEFSNKLQEEIKKRKLIIKKNKPLSMKTTSIFIKILSTQRVYETLYEMHRLNILDRLFPDFGRLRHLVVYEPYHRYTVDEHTLRTIKHLESLRVNKIQRFPILNEISKDVPCHVLYLALLFHDIGKGIYGSTMKHEGEGYKRLKTILETFELSNQDKRMIEFLVKNHILLSNFALKRDIDDNETIISVAEAVENEKNLKALLLITFADMAAVNPDYFTEWRCQLLINLYSKTLAHLRGMTSEVDSYLEHKEFIALLPERYAITNTSEEIKKDHHLFNSAITEGTSVEIRKKREDTTEIVVVAFDARCLFLKILDVIGSVGLNIVQARLYPTKNEMVLDKIVVSNWNDLQYPGFTDYFKNKMKENIKKETTILDGINEENYMDKIKSGGLTLPSHLVNFETFVEIDNESSSAFTIIEFFAPDRIG